jgi:hypothetical protein
MQIDEDEIDNIHFEVNFGSHHIKSDASNITELAIANLQRALPPNIKIASCQSCRHGNFCPFGDRDNEVFCFKDIEINDKSNLCKLFSDNINCIKIRSRKLLDFCKDYKPISHSEYYTYNDWDYE